MRPEARAPAAALAFVGALLVGAVLLPDGGPQQPQGPPSATAPASAPPSAPPSPVAPATAALAPSPAPVPPATRQSVPGDPAPPQAARAARLFAVAWSYHPPGHPEGAWRDAMAPYAERTALDAAVAAGGRHSYRGLGQPRWVAGDARLAQYAVDLDPETELRVVVADGPRGWAALVSWARSREHG